MLERRTRASSEIVSPAVELLVSGPLIALDVTGADWATAGSGPWLYCTLRLTGCDTPGSVTLGELPPLVASVDEPDVEVEFSRVPIEEPPEPLPAGRENRSRLL